MFGMFYACSSSDEVTAVYEGYSTNDSSEKEKGEGIQGCSDEMVEFQLQNEYGIECYDFKEGDNIIFRLEFRNDSDEDAQVARFSEIIGWDGFRVYSIEGKDMGTPWDQIVTNSRMYDFIGAHSSEVILCPWFDIPALYCNGHEQYYSNMYYKTDEKMPLPKGQYYSRFEIKFEDKVITCNRNFIIR
jgi:hypothetical protein